jgi:hypothetical protein
LRKLRNLQNQKGTNMKGLTKFLSPQKTNCARGLWRWSFAGGWCAAALWLAATNSSLAQGTLTPGVQTSGGLGLPGDSQSWTFSANAGDTVIVRVGATVLTGTNSLDPYIKLYAPGGGLVAQNGGYGLKAEDVSHRATVGGTFTAVITAGVRAGGYVITLGQTGVAINPLSNGYRTRSSLIVGGLGQWSFHANAGDGILVRMGNMTTNGTLDPYLRLYDPSGALVSIDGSYGYKAEDGSPRATTAERSRCLSAAAVPAQMTRRLSHHAGEDGRPVVIARR